MLTDLLMLAPAPAQASAILGLHARQLVALYDDSHLAVVDPLTQDEIAMRAALYGDSHLAVVDPLTQDEIAMRAAIDLLRNHMALPAGSLVSWASVLDLTRAATMATLAFHRTDPIGEIFTLALGWDPQPTVEVAEKPTPEDCPARLAWKECPICGGAHTGKVTP